MSVEAMAWAFRQNLPAKPKIVLLALADQTDGRTGRVCYGKTDAKYLAQKSTASERSLYRYLAALIRNGYVIRESGKDRGHESQFWLCLDRLATALKDWQWNIIPSDDDAAEADDDAQDVEGGYAILAEGESPENAPESTQIGRPPPPIGGRPRLSEGRRDITPPAGQEQESGFSRQAQDLERDAAAIRKKAEQENVRVFVIYGTRAWDAWIEHRKKTRKQSYGLPITNGFGEFVGKRGWYLPSLFPPPESATDPPSTLTDEDAREMMKF